MGTHRSARSRSRILTLALAICAATVPLAASPPSPETPTVSLTPEPTVSGAPTATPSSPSPTPAEPTTPATPAPSPGPAYPPLRATVGVSDWFGCDRIVNGACFSDIDSRELTYTAEFDGARVTDSNLDGPTWWSLELPGTAMGIGPGGTVRGRITAIPEDVFRVLDVECTVFDVDLWDERPVPATVEGNGVILEFDVAPTEDDPNYHCTLIFDPTGVPRFPPDPEPPRAALTGLVEAIVLEGPPEVGRPLRFLSGWRLEPDFGDAVVRRSRPTTGDEDHPAMWDLDLTAASTPAVLTVIPPSGFGVRSVACFLDDSEEEWPTTFVGNRLSFELVPAATWCSFIAGPALPSTDLAQTSHAERSDASWQLLSVVLAGLLAGLLVSSRRHARG
jgi:hypothetical protein